MTKSEITPFPLRMPAALRTALEARAKTNGRSANSEILAIITDALDGKAPPSGNVPESALAALTYRITWLETELMARQADLALYTELMGTLVSALPLEAHDDPKVKPAIKEAARSAKRFRRTEEEKAAMAAQHREKLHESIKLMQQVHALPEVDTAATDPKRTRKPKD